MSGDGVEIERKFRLLSTPDPALLDAHGAETLRIEQVYLRTPPAGRRVRRIERPDGSVELRFTQKGRTSGLTRSEREHPISPAEYERLLAEADPAKRPIRKTRHVVAHGDQALEIDVFESPPGLVIVEVELGHEDEPVDLPAWLGAHRDVSLEAAYLNANLARIGARVPPYRRKRRRRTGVGGDR